MSDIPNREAPQKRRKRRENVTRVACNTCRSRKLACDGVRPACTRCDTRGEQCIYDTQTAEQSRIDVLRERLRVLEVRLAAYDKAMPHLASLPTSQLEDALKHSTIPTLATDTKSPDRQVLQVLAPARDSWPVANGMPSLTSRTASDQGLTAKPTPLVAIA